MGDGGDGGVVQYVHGVHGDYMVIDCCDNFKDDDYEDHRISSFSYLEHSGG